MWRPVCSPVTDTVNVSPLWAPYSYSSEQELITWSGKSNDVINQTWASCSHLEPVEESASHALKEWGWTLYQEKFGCFLKTEPKVVWWAGKMCSIGRLQSEKTVKKILLCLPQHLGPCISLASLIQRNPPNLMVLIVLKSSGQLLCRMWNIFF